MENKEFIVCSAIIYNGTIVCGLRHKDCSKIIEGLLDSEHEIVIMRKEQGFLTSLNRFVNRKDALIIAKANKQLIHTMFDDDTDPDRELTSEDLFGIDD